MTRGLLAEFETADALVAAARRLRAQGYQRVEAYTRFYVVGLDDALGHRPSRLPAVALLGALGGAILAYLVQWFTNAWDYPLNAGGRPAHAAPAFVPISVQMGILAGVVTGVVALLVATGLPALWHPLFEVDGFERVSRDRFFLGVDREDARFDPEASVRDLLASGARRVTAVGLDP